MKPEFVGWIGEGRTRARRRWEGFVYDEISVASGYANKSVVLQRVEGEWPDDATLITLADGDDPEHPSHFGGKVWRYAAGMRRVTVYID